MSVDAALHRRLAVELFNRTWTLLELEGRSADDDDELIAAANASAYHWIHAEGTRPENRARSQWQLARVHAVLGHGPEAVRHATRCLELCEEHGIGDWDLAFAHEALARAHRVAGDEAAFRRHLELARSSGAAIADAEDREHLEQALAELA